MTPSERLVSTLPWMGDYSNQRSYDFRYTLDGSRVEVKGCLKATGIPSGYDGLTLQVRFQRVYPNQFDWLICAHQDETGYWHILLLSAEQCRRLVTQDNQITYVLGGHSTRPELTSALITYNALWKLCGRDKSLNRSTLQRAFDSVQLHPGDLKHQFILYLNERRN